MKIVTETNLFKNNYKKLLSTIHFFILNLSSIFKIESHTSANKWINFPSSTYISRTEHQDVLTNKTIICKYNNKIHFKIFTERLSLYWIKNVTHRNVHTTFLLALRNPPAFTLDGVGDVFVDELLPASSSSRSSLDRRPVSSRFSSLLC